MIINGLLAPSIFSMAGDWGMVIGMDFLTWKILTPEDLDWFTPRKMNGWNLKNHPIEKENHLPNHHFQLPAVNLPGCTDWASQKGKEESFRKCRRTNFCGDFCWESCGERFSLGATFGETRCLARHFLWPGRNFPLKFMIFWEKE